MATILGEKFMIVPKNYTIGLVIYPGMTALDIVGPQQVFSGLPPGKIHRLGKN